MAGQDNGSSNWATTEDLSEEESADYQLMFKHFKENKVEIASAITKSFPFLMSLRDRGFISEQKFQDSQEKCQNLVPVAKVVYDILSDLQNKFSLSLLEVIFSTTHLKAYPDLKETVSFLDASDSPGNSQMNDEQAEEVPSLPQCNRGEGSSSCEQMFDGQEPQDDLSSSPLRPEAGAEQSTSGNEMCSCVMCSPAYMREDPEARMGSSQAATVETGNNTTVGKSQGKKRKKKGHKWSRAKQRRLQTIRPTSKQAEGQLQLLSLLR
ncbi:hypothetical protein A6R68_07178, partial [Neotoma lepida]